MHSLNGREYTGAPTQMPAGQTRPGVQVPDHRDAEGVASASANLRITAVTGIIVGLIPLLSPIGLLLSIIAFFGYRRRGRSPRLAVIGILVSTAVIVASAVYLLVAVPVS